jgi:hypothetical protein
MNDATTTREALVPSSDVVTDLEGDLMTRDEAEAILEMSEKQLDALVIWKAVSDPDFFPHGFTVKDLGHLKIRTVVDALVVVGEVERFVRDDGAVAFREVLSKGERLRRLRREAQSLRDHADQLDVTARSLLTEVDEDQ